MCCFLGDLDCFQQGLYVEGSIPMAMTFFECQDACFATDCCKVLPNSYILLVYLLHWHGLTICLYFLPVHHMV